MKRASIFTLGILIGTIFSSALVIAWTGPTSAPPNGNVSAPINVGSVLQEKQGIFGAYGILNTGSFTLLGSNRYISFDSTPDSSGYGIRDNAGVMELKNIGGAWSPLFAANRAMKVPDNTGATVCNTATGGTMRYNSTSKVMEFCDGTAWCTFSGCGTSVSQTFTSSGTFVVPTYNSLTVQCWGGGGAGAGDGDGSTNGGSGSASTFSTLSAGGGRFGVDNGSGGVGGTASGGSTNTIGNSGGNGTSAQGGAGGNAPNGGAGGAATVGNSLSGNAGTAPGGGGSGAKGISSGSGGGGSGAYVSNTYSPGQLTAGASIAVIIGTGGAPGSGDWAGGQGARGECRMIWN